MNDNFNEKGNDVNLNNENTTDVKASFNASFILDGLPCNGKLKKLIKKDDGYIKQPKISELKHATEPFNYIDGPNYVQKVENNVMSIADCVRVVDGAPNTRNIDE